MTPDIQCYQQCKNTLWDDFMRRNPVTMKKAIEEWMNQGSDNKQNEEAIQKNYLFIPQRNVRKIKNNLIQKQGCQIGEGIQSK
ncbi:hypothetical protein pb186bvf_019854 [Paramecium bursaria]